MLGGVLVLMVVLVAATSGFGKDDPSGDSVAVVDGQEISQEDFDRALAQAAARQGAGSNCQPPAEDDPQYETLRDEALNDVLDQEWILGEAEERGVSVSDREVQEEFEQTKNQNFKSEKEYQDFLRQSCFEQEDVDERVRLQVISTKIQEEVTSEAAEVSDADAETFYEANEEQFSQPEQRDLRLVLNQDPEKAQEAADQLEQDNSPENWKQVAAEFSSDASSKENGGVRESITQGVFPEAVDAQIFDAAEGEVVGPIETDSGTYVFQVDSVTEETTTPLDEARPQIQEQLASQLQQEGFSAFLSDYRDRWVELTVCADDFVNERCDNFAGEVEPCPDPSLPEDQQRQQIEETGCPPPVLPRNPAAPGSILPFIAASGSPQRPHPAGADQEVPAGIPGGVPGGVPGAAGGAVPVTPGAPPGG
ncbi:MAG: peptidylprolyl isomerase [Solirubrobacterales bacterium]|nr:peptidylprolyl isomerase [Solirubrobacterales bacterium]